MPKEIERLEKQAILLGEIWTCLMGESAKKRADQMLVEKQEEIKKVVFNEK